MSQQPEQEEENKATVVPRPSSIIIRAIPYNVDELLKLFRSSFVGVEEHRDEVLGEFIARTQRMNKTIDMYSSIMISYSSEPASVMTPPESVKEMYRSRLLVTATMACNIIEKHAESVAAKMRECLSSESKAPQCMRRVFEELINFVEHVKLMHLTIVDISIKLHNILSSNLPAHLRSPLVNIRVAGADKMG